VNLNGGGIIECRLPQRGRKEFDMQYNTKWTEGNGSWTLMEKGGDIIKVEDGLIELAIAQGAKEIKAETVSLTPEIAKKIGIWDDDEERGIDER
jgi:hypothetical protein